jgi:hypothetical protein
MLRREAGGAVSVVWAGKRDDIEAPRIDNMVVQTVNMVVGFVDG